MVYGAVTAFLGVSSRPTPSQAAAVFEGMVLTALAEGGLSELLQAECALISAALEKADRTDAAERHYAQAEDEITMLAQKVRNLEWQLAQATEAQGSPLVAEDGEILISVASGAKASPEASPSLSEAHDG